MTINCTAIPEQLLESELFGHEKGAFTGATEARMGKFQLAGDGDILLDEIGDMDLQMQSKLLRVLESREFERVGGREIIPLRAGIIASTNQNLLAMSERRAFRADLYYRLSTIELYLPPLRARPEDIPLLIDRLCAQKGGRLRLTSQAMEYLQRYTWPGNVRQLKNLVGRWLVFYDGVQITGRHVVDELTIGQRSYNEAFGVTDPLAGTASPSGPFSIANDVAKYFAIIPAMFVGLYPGLQALNIMRLHSPESAIFSAILYNALIIVALIPLALKGVRYREVPASKMLSHNLLVYGLGGILAPFLFIKLFDVILGFLGIL